ncbi:MAG: hypothetical protein IJY61_04535 [Candidatus Gastranaerophilales bacterium]|nr:hypothetical protein [Candidatus Gastranaerophilales bacterium]
MDIQRNKNIGKDISIQKNNKQTEKKENPKPEMKIGDLSAQLDSMAASQRAFVNKVSFKGVEETKDPQPEIPEPTEPQEPVFLSSSDSIGVHEAWKLSAKYFTGNFGDENGLFTLKYNNVRLTHAMDLGYNLQELANMNADEAKKLIEDHPELKEGKESEPAISVASHASEILNMDLNEIEKLGYDLRELCKTDCEEIYGMLDSDAALMRLFIVSNLKENELAEIGVDVDKLAEGTVEDFWHEIIENPQILEHRTEKASFKQIYSPEVISIDW